MNLFSLILLVLGLSAPLLGGTGTASSNNELQPLRLATTGGYRPFSTLDKNGKLVGFDADIAREVARRLDRNPDLVQIEWDGIQAGLQSRKYDVICASMAITPERLKNMHFSLPYYVSGAQLFVRRGLSSIDGASIGVTQQTTYAKYLEDHPHEFPDAEVFYFPDDSQIVAAMNAGKIDAFISDRIVGGFYIQQGRGDAGDIVPFGDLLYQESCGIAARLESYQLIQDINQTLFSLIQDGTYSQIYETWVGHIPDIELLLSSWAQHSHTIPTQSSSSTPGIQPVTFADNISSMLPVLMEAARLTLLLSLLTACIAFVTGSLVGVGCISRSAIVRSISNGFIWIVRGTPLLVQLFIAYFAFATFINDLVGQQVIQAFGAGLLALTVNMTAYNAETLRGGLLAIDKGQWDAAASLGMRRNKIVQRIILPQAYRDAFPSFGNNIVVLIKDTSLVGVITLIELTFAARGLSAQSGDAFTPYLLAGIFYIAIISCVTLGAQKLEQRLQQSRQPIGKQL